MVTYLGSLLQLLGREEHCKEISLACEKSACSVWTALGLPQLTAACALFGSTLLRLQVALQGYCPMEALHFMHFPGLSCSGSGSWVLHRGTDSVGCVLCAFTRFEQLSASQVHCPRWTMHLNRLPGPCHSVSRVCQESTVSGVLCFSSGELISGCDSPGRCQLSRVPRRLG